MSKRAGGAPVVSIADAAGTARARLEALRGEIREVGAELEEEVARPVTVAEAEIRIAQAVRRLGGQARDSLEAGWFLAPDLMLSDDFLSRLAGRGVTALSLAALIDPDALTKLFAEKMRQAATRAPDGVDAGERHRRVTALRIRLAALEREEAAAVWTALEAGFELPLRADMNPAALLGMAD